MSSCGDQIGITSTIPVEVIFAAGYLPVDLNNLFISSPDKERYVEISHEEGFPQGSCAWIKGIFGAVMDCQAIKKVIGIVRGDCSGTEILLQALERHGVEVIPFAYPFPKNAYELIKEIDKLCRVLGTDINEAVKWFRKLRPARERIARIDLMCWRENVVSGLENHLWLVSSSDFKSDPESFANEAEEFIMEAGRRDPLDQRYGLPFKREVRLAYVGVPPIDVGLFPLVEEMGARFVFHETQRQFSMIHSLGKPGRKEIRDALSAVFGLGKNLQEEPEDLVSFIAQYLAYTYPYSLSDRVADINEQCDLRRIDGVVHYVQSFCYRNMEDVIFSRELKLPFITVECDCPGTIGAQARLRMENFVQVLGENI